MWGAGSNSLESSKSAEAELVPVTEGSMSTIDTRDGDTPPGWKAASRMKGNLREPGGPIGSIERSAMGAPCEGQPKHGAEPRSGVGPAHSTKEALEGNEGVDGETVVTYEQDLESNLKDLCERVHTGRYRPLPVRRVYIPKADGGQR